MGRCKKKWVRKEEWAIAEEWGQGRRVGHRVGHGVGSLAVVKWVSVQKEVENHCANALILFFPFPLSSSLLLKIKLGTSVLMH